jgi:hypothetical protein
MVRSADVEDARSGRGDLLSAVPYSGRDEAEIAVDDLVAL